MRVEGPFSRHETADAQDHRARRLPPRGSGIPLSRGRMSRGRMGRGEAGGIDARVTTSVGGGSFRSRRTAPCRERRDRQHDGRLPEGLLQRGRKQPGADHELSSVHRHGIGDAGGAQDPGPEEGQGRVALAKCTMSKRVPARSRGLGLEAGLGAAWPPVRAALRRRASHRRPRSRASPGEDPPPPTVPTGQRSNRCSSRCHREWAGNRW